MDLAGKRILITGGAGFIGSHLVDVLVKNENEIMIFDNLSGGKVENIMRYLENPKVKFVKGDLLKSYDLNRVANNYDVIFHLAANAEVKQEDPNVHFEENIHSTFHLLEMMRRSDTKFIVFASTSTVYGEPRIIPTPEDYSPLKPISFYGASKLACESLISAHCNHYDMRSLIYRMANIIGPDTEHSVVRDFVVKLEKDPSVLEILGDGTQEKSYLHVEDCISAMLHATRNCDERITIFNIGSEDRIKVVDIAKIVLDEIGLKDVKLNFVQEVEDGRGWKGDVKLMQLSIDKLKATGWRPKYNSEQAIRGSVRYLISSSKVNK